MKGILKILAGVLVVAVAAYIAVLAGLIYSAARRADVQPVVFQVSNYNDTADLKSFDDLSDAQMIDLLIRRWAVEAYRVLPDVQDVRARAQQGVGSFIWYMSDHATDVFKVWDEEVRPELESLATQHNYREVQVLGVAPQGDYYKVDLRFKTWSAPDKFVMQDKVIFLKVEFFRELRPNVERILQQGDASKIFRFRVVDFREMD